MTPEEQAEVRQRMAARARERAEMAEGPYRRKAVSTPLIRSGDSVAEALVLAAEEKVTAPPEPEPIEDPIADPAEDPIEEQRPKPRAPRKTN